ncbi:MAG: ribosome small subunit-dependent GTPase A [Pseudomonadota bacterium]
MTSIHATIIETYSQRMRLRLEDDTEVDARIKGKRLRPVCGDRVAVERIDNEDDWLITAIHDRRNALTRPNMRGDTEVLAANVDQLVVTAASQPAPDWYVVDRYICAAEAMDVDAVVVFNKTDIGSAAAAIRVYSELGYTVLEASAKHGNHLDQLAEALTDRVSLIVGQSGVGKSTLINALMGTEKQKTASISDKHREGRHTTVNSVMLDLPRGGKIIDSPGVRDFAPALESVEAVTRGFREIERLRQNCKFANCRHMEEPGCAVKTGLDNDELDGRRYESYRRLLRLTESLTSR